MSIVSSIPMKISHGDRLAISTVSIDRAKEVIKKSIKNVLVCWEKGKQVKPQTFHLIGPAGLGKTRICNQICNEITEETGKEFNISMIKAPTKSRDDILCPYPVPQEATFKMLYSDFVPKHNQEYGIFVIDEFSRGDYNLQQLLWDAMDENKIHTYKFPKGWFVICLDNPDDEQYSMNYVEDAAGMRRSCKLYCELSTKAFLNYAKGHKFHPLVISFVETNPGMLYDFEAQKLGRVYANPASWERVSDILWGYEYGDDIEKCLTLIEETISGLVNTSISRVFIDFIKNHECEVKPEEIFRSYQSVKPKIKKFIDESNNIKLGQLMTSLLKYLSSEKPKVTNGELTNLKDFILSLPLDIGVMYITTQHEIKNEDFDGYMHLANIQTSLMSNPEFKERFYQVMKEISEKAQKEKSKGR